MAERDAAIQERNLALSEKKTALAERDIAILQRDTAIAERNSAVLERDNAMAALQYRENTMNNSGDMSACPPGCQAARGVKHIHHLDQHPPHMIETPTNPSPMSPVPSEPAKARNTKRTKEPKSGSPAKKLTTKATTKVKQENEEFNNTIFGKSQFWKDGPDMDNGQLVGSKPDWKNQDLGLNQVAYDETTMPVPVCSCTGVLRPCYKWGNGGWQSSCCTTNLSMYPLPTMPNKRHARVGGRKMSGSAFTKLLSRLAGEGHDLSNPVDLRNHWAKHGTNRYITIK